ncbi:Uncharacterised protein [Mycobacterium tuberculosis]|nr:Uncharacterised protein [Mycobacterium tuberculosis]
MDSPSSINSRSSTSPFAQTVTAPPPTSICQPGCGATASSLLSWCNERRSWPM